MLPVLNDEKKELKNHKCNYRYMIVYVYDLKFKTKKEFNKIKRNFYYSLNSLITKLNTQDVRYLTKSTLLVADAKETLFDSFFLAFRQKTGTASITVFKIFANDIEEL
ncbi:MAG: hypothetical protein QXT45_01105 [Candidatus Bilamarchaeaceae archaeon]